MIRILLLTVAVVFVSCRPRGILSSQEMREVLVDLHKVDAMLQVAGYTYTNENIQNVGEIRNIYYAQVLEKHGITQAQFDSSLVWYTAHPEYFDKIYPKVLADLKAEEDRFKAEHKNKLVPEPVKKSTQDLQQEKQLQKQKEKQAKQQEKQAAEPVKTEPVQWDSLIWVMYNGAPTLWHPYEPLVHDSVDQLFPEICVLR